MLGDAYLAIVQFMEQGGNVLFLIAALTFLMWTLIFERLWYFNSNTSASSGWRPMNGKTGRKGVPGAPIRFATG